MIYQKLSNTVFSGEDPKTPQNYIQLKSLGVKYVLNLQMGYLDFFFRKLRNHGFMEAMDYGIKTVHIMMSDIIAPSFKELDYALKVLQTYESVYFHCRRGKDRTGMVRAVYRVFVQGWDVERAIKEMVDLGHAVFPYFWWRNHLRKYCVYRKAKNEV